jgi:UDP-N-acetylglucosamine 2-epimerase
VYPVHLNPAVQEPVHRELGGVPRVHLIAPLAYWELVDLLRRSYLVVTDSGGIQEEAPTLGKPVVVLRETTERPEGVTAGTAVLVGTGRAGIVSTVEGLLQDPAAYARMSAAHNPYGDGRASERIVAVVEAALAHDRSRVAT